MGPAQVDRISGSGGDINTIMYSKMRAGAERSASVTAAATEVITASHLRLQKRY